MQKYKQKIILAVTLALLSISSVGMAHAQIAQKEQPKISVDNGYTDPSANRQEFFGIVGQRMIAYLTILRTAIERSVGLLDTQKKQLITDIAKELSQIQAQTLIIGKTQTPTELATRVTALREQWQRAENKFKYFVSLIASARVGSAISRFDEVSKKIDILIQRLEKENLNTEMIKQKRVLFLDALAAAKGSYDLAQIEYKKIQSQADGQEVFQKGNEYLKKADASLRDTRNILRKLLQDIQKLIPRENRDPISSTTLQQI